MTGYYHREEFAVRNAALTAEAAAAKLMEMLAESVSNVQVLILGYGRIGRLLSAILKALDAKVTVAARRFSDLAWIRSEGMTPLEFRLLDEKISDFKVVLSKIFVTIYSNSCHTNQCCVIRIFFHSFQLFINPAENSIDFREKRVQFLFRNSRHLATDKTGHLIHLPVDGITLEWCLLPILIHKCRIFIQELEGFQTRTSKTDNHGSKRRTHSSRI